MIARTAASAPQHLCAKLAPTPQGPSAQSADEKPFARTAGLAAPLKTFGQELLGAVSPLFFVLVNLAEEFGEVLIVPGVAGVLHVKVRPLEGVIENTNEIIRGIVGTGFVGHGEASSGEKNSHAIRRRMQAL